MRILIIFLQILVYLNLHFCRKYTNFSLMRVIPLNEDQLQFLEMLSERYDVNLWRPPGKLRTEVEFMIAPEHKTQFMKDADGKDLYYATIIDDVQSAFDMQTVNTYIRRNMESFGWTSYFRVQDIYSWLEDLYKSNPETMKIINLGTTYEGRKILAVKINLRSSLKRSTVIVEGGIHAREWISSAFVTYFLHQILNALTSTDKNLKKIAITYEWFFIPVLNPDGYDYTHTQDRMWRKNRRDGYGVDLNRNFDAAFGSVGVSNNKYSEIYCGERAFSESETKAMSSLIRSQNRTLEYYIAFHSYGQYLILPYTYTKEHLANFNEMKKIGDEMASAISRRNGTKYTVGTAYETVGYATAGVSGCWVKKVFNVPYVATLELPDNGRYGFALPPNNILQVCQETMDGMLTLLTPRTDSYTPSALRKPDIHENELAINAAQDTKILDIIVMFFNIFFFIIVRFD